MEEIRKKMRRRKYASILARATVLGIMSKEEFTDRMMDVESADEKFNLRLDDWMEAGKFDFAHDFFGIIENINREDGFPATDFGLFVPRFAGETHDL